MSAAKRQPGEFRRTQNWIGPPGSTLNEATFVPPPAPEMKGPLDSFEKYLHADNSYPPLIRLALIHYQFETIHPFLDGNGRIGRLLISLLLVHWGLLPHPLLYLSAFFEQHRQDYYDLLLAVSNRGAWREWILFFLCGVEEQTRDAVKRAKLLQDLQQMWRTNLAQAGSTARVLALIDSPFESPFVSVPMIQRTLEVSYPTAQSYVRGLVSVGVLSLMANTTHPQWYLADDILKAIGERE